MYKRQQLKPTAGEVEVLGAPVGMETLGRLCLIGDTPDFGGLKNAREFLNVCAGLFPAWQREPGAGRGDAGALL